MTGRCAEASFPLLRQMEPLPPEPTVQGVPDPPALPPKSPLRGLRPATSLNALAITAPSLATSSSTPGAGPSSAHQGRRPPPITVPPLPRLSVPTGDSFDVHNSPPTASNSMSSLSRSQSAGRRPSFASSHISSNSGASQSTPTSLDTVSRLALANSPATTTVASPMSLTSRISATASTIRSSASASSSTPALAAHITKRTHALTELLTSERVYASDLAIMRHVHIPLALGQPPLFHPPSSSDGSLFQDDASSGDPPPMTSEDVSVIFSNIEEMAIFADAFAERIENHMGDALLSMSDGTSSLTPSSSSSSSNARKDSIGDLFMEVVSIVSPYVFTAYSPSRGNDSHKTFTPAFITGPSHETTLHGLHHSTPSCAFPPRCTRLTCSRVTFQLFPPHLTPSKNNSTSSTDKNVSINGNVSHYSTVNSYKAADMAHPMKKYLATTRTLTERHTNAWDLPSLLIKVCFSFFTRHIL